MPSLIALLLAAAAAAVHMRSSLIFFQPVADDFIRAFAPWGPHLLSAWAPHLARLAAAALFFASLPGLGARLTRRLPAPPLRFFVQIAAALVLWSTLGLLLAALGLSKTFPLRLLSAALVAAGLFWRRGAEWPTRIQWRETFRFPTGAAAAAFAALYLLTTVVPETFYDALVYHLAVPHAFLQAGRLVDIPDVHLSRLPGLIQTLYLWGLAWSDDRLCKVVTVGFGFLSAAALGAWVGRLWSAGAGRWAALLFLSSPMIGVNLWSCANDVLCGYFFLLAFVVWLAAWAPEPDGRELDRNLLALSGFLFGAAAAAKYTAFFGGLFFALDLIVRRGRARRAIYEPGIVFAAAAMLPLLPWWFRTAAFTGNPFFPQAAGLLGGDTPENILLLKTWTADTAGHRALFSRALALVRDSLFGVEHGRFGFAGPALLMTLVLVPFLRYGEVTRSLVGCALTSYAMFTMTTGRLRYFIPQMGLLFALGAAALEDYARTAREHGTLLVPRGARGRWRALLDPAAAMKALLALVVASNAAWLVFVFQRYNQGWDVVWGRVPARDYLQAEHIGVYGNPSQGAFDFLADQRRAGEPVQGRILIVGDARSHRSPLPARASGTFNTPTYALWLAEDPSPRAFIQRLRDEGYTYLLLNADEMHRITPSQYQAGAPLHGFGQVLDMLPEPVYRDRWAILFPVPQAGATPGGDGPIP